MKKYVMTRAWEIYRVLRTGTATHREALSKALRGAWKEAKAAMSAKGETAHQMLTSFVESASYSQAKAMAERIAEKLGLVLDGRAITIKSDCVCKSRAFATLDDVTDFVKTHFDCKGHGTFRALTFVTVEDREIKKRRMPGKARFMDSLAYGEKVAEMYADM